MDIYEQMKAAGVPIDNHESDLYAKATPASRAIVEGLHREASQFTSEIDGEQWYEFPFAYSPFWDAVSARSIALDAARTASEGGE